MHFDSESDVVIGTILPTGEFVLTFCCSSHFNVNASKSIVTKGNHEHTNELNCLLETAKLLDFSFVCGSYFDTLACTTSPNCYELELEISKPNYLFG